MAADQVVGMKMPNGQIVTQIVSSKAIYLWGLVITHTLKLSSCNYRPLFRSKLAALQ